MKADQKVTAPMVKTFTEGFPKPFIDGSNPNAGEYTGYAPLGVQTNQAGWQITLKRTANGVTQHLYPNGSMAFEFVWDDRASYNYGR